MMNTNAWKCPNCQSEYECDEMLAGRVVRCEVCRKPFMAPQMPDKAENEKMLAVEVQSAAA